jgi:hypothetical protein
MSKSGVCNAVEALTDVESIDKLLADKCRELYTCLSYDTGEMRSLINDMSELIRDNFCPVDYILIVSEIESAVKKLKPHKGVSSDHFLNACDDPLICIKMLYSAIIVYGF